MVWYSHLLKNFLQFVVIHPVKGFSVINEVEVDIFFWNSLAFQMILHTHSHTHTHTHTILMMLSEELLELNKFGKIAGHKINTQKSLAFLYSSNEKSKGGIQETIPFTFTSNRNATLFLKC